ncbi:MAG: diguanylate cyclase [Candidatus Eremiobacteraeota bacterium]|nr:diguanylate cyclase [Candidatus Eremiobacteraeota bacterium]
MPTASSSDKRTVLVVDDLPANIGKMAEALGDLYILKTASSGARALDYVNSEEPPDLILLDVVMPGLDGHQVCRAIKANPETADIPIIFVTSQDTHEEEVLGLRLGAVDYITKPFNPAIVRARVENHLKLKEYQDLLKRRSHLDGLTGLPNRRDFDETLEREWKRGERLGSPLSLLLIDVDHFKSYNDRYGHLKGDDCLRRVSTTLAAEGRATDFVGRYGGEEFVALLPHTDLQGAREVGEKLRRCVENLAISHEASSASERVTISLGLASCLPTPDQPSTSLVETADEQLYLAKQAGRNRLCG